jgi:hypothetical protein
MMLLLDPCEGYRETYNGAQLANRIRPGHGTIVGCFGMVLSLPTQSRSGFRAWVAVRRILQLREARGIPYQFGCSETACDFKPL